MADLNPEQLEAVSHGEGPALVLAGPGTGKTKTLVSRYCRLVRAGVAPTSILATTFSKQAAAALKQRMRDQLRVNTSSLPVSTFHAFCNRVLRNHVDIPAIDGWSVLDDGLRRLKILSKLTSPETGDADDLGDAIARYKDRLITPEAAQALAHSSPLAQRASKLALANAYDHYQSHLREHRLLDFGDMILHTVTALRASQELRQEIAGQFRFLMVDEYQDINPAQDTLLELLLLGHRNLWVVGDDDQAIYGWRGSDVSYIAEFEDRFGGARVVRLERNYRSRDQILQVADCLIRNNSNRLGKKLRPEQSGKTKLVICHARDERTEAEWIARSVQKLIQAGTPHSEIAVLVRTKHLTVPVAAGLRRRGIPHIVRPPSDFWKLPEVNAVLEVARHLDTDSADLTLTLAYLEGPVSSALQDSRGQPFNAQLRSAASSISRGAPRSAPDERKIAWSGNALQAAEEASPYERPSDYLAYVEGQRLAPRTKEGEEAVIVSTIHRAKGLEWEAVFVAAVEAGVLPHSKAEDEEEERRLAFVALTRAKRYLSVSHAEQRVGKPAAPSQFLAEMTREIPSHVIDERTWPEVKQGQTDPATEAGVRASSRVSKVVEVRSPRDLRQPDPVAQLRVLPRCAVEHPSYGIGVVLSTDVKRAVVKFRDGGIYRIPLRNLSLIATESET